MKVTNNHLRIAILALGGILILYGLLKILFKVDFGPWLDQNLPTGIMLGAAAIFVWNRQIWNREKKERDAEEAARKAKEEDGDPKE